MAVVKNRLLRKTTTGYDTIHLETSATLVKMNDGTTVQDAVTGTVPKTRGGTGANFSDIYALRYFMGGYHEKLDAAGYKPFDMPYPFMAKGCYIGLTLSDDWVVYDISRYSMKIFAMFISKTGVRAMPASDTTGKFDIDQSAIAQACEECEANYNSTVLDMLEVNSTSTKKRFTALGSYELEHNAVLKNPYHRVVDSQPYWLNSGAASTAQYVSSSGVPTYTSNMAYTCGLRLAATVKLS